MFPACGKHDDRQGTDQFQCKQTLDKQPGVAQMQHHLLAGSDPLGQQVCAKLLRTGAKRPISLYVKPVSYVVTLLIVLASYLLSLVLAGRKVERIEMTESLKRNNE